MFSRQFTINKMICWFIFLLASCDLSIGVPDQNNNGSWWNYQYFYQVFVRSFKDSNGDGIGDIKGVTSGLSHIESLGVNSIILSPIFETINDCDHYGMNNFQKIDSVYGSIEHFDELVVKSSKAGLKIILDLPLHQISPHSDWLNSSANKIPGYENYFKWIDTDLKREDHLKLSRNDSMVCPDAIYNNQLLWNEIRKQEYVSETRYKYPLLNFKEFNLITEIKNILKYWLDRGVFGFRFEATPVASEYDNDFSYMIHHLRSFIDKYSKENSGPPRILIGQSKNDAKYTFERNKHFMEDSFHVNFVDSFITGFNKQSGARDAKFIVEKSMTYDIDDNKPNWMIGNFQASRISSRNGQSHAELIAMMAFILPGNIIINQGDEIGMTDVELHTSDDLNKETCGHFFEDSERYPKTSPKSPFQWDDTYNAGFGNSDTTWLPIANNYKTINLLKQKKKATSRFKLYRMLGSFRQSHTLKEGDITLKVLPDNILTFTRYVEEFETFLVVINFGPHTQTADLSVLREISDESTVIIATEYSTYVLGDKVPSQKVKLTSGEAVVLMAPHKTCGSKPVEKIMSKLSDAMQKINSYINFRDLKN